MSAMKILATALAEPTPLTLGERELIFRATLAGCEARAGKGMGHAFLAGMLSEMLTDAQLREAFAISQERQA